MLVLLFKTGSKAFHGPEISWTRCIFKGQSSHPARFSSYEHTIDFSIQIWSSIGRWVSPAGPQAHEIIWSIPEWLYESSFSVKVIEISFTWDARSLCSYFHFKLAPVLSVSVPSSALLSTGKTWTCWTLAEVAQRGGRYPIPGNIPSHVKWGNFGNSLLKTRVGKWKWEKTVIHFPQQVLI